MLFELRIAIIRYYIMVERCCFLAAGIITCVLHEFEFKSSFPNGENQTKTANLCLSSPVIGTHVFCQSSRESGNMNDSAITHSSSLGTLHFPLCDLAALLAICW
jgi:hypothetical protein